MDEETETNLNIESICSDSQGSASQLWLHDCRTWGAIGTTYALAALQQIKNTGTSLASVFLKHPEWFQFSGKFENYFWENKSSTPRVRW